MNSAYGHFLWAASDFRSNLGNQSAYLNSEILLAYQYQNGACLTFSYFVKGPSILNVYGQERAIGENTTLLWTVEQDQGNQWLQGQVDISVVDNDLEVRKNEVRAREKNILFQIYFEGKFDSFDTPGAIALDDLYVHPSTCANIDTTPSPSTPFDCGDGTIVPQLSVW